MASLLLTNGSVSAPFPEGFTSDMEACVSVAMPWHGHGTLARHACSRREAGRVRPRRAGGTEL